MVPIEMSSPHSYLTSVHTIGLSCTVWPQYKTRQQDTSDIRPTDIAIGIDHLCYSIDGLVIGCKYQLLEILIFSTFSALQCASSISRLMFLNETRKRFRLMLSSMSAAVADSAVTKWF